MDLVQEDPKNTVSINAGRLLFQKRSYTPLILGFLLFLPFHVKTTGITLFMAFLGFMLGQSLRLWSVNFATGATRTRKDQEHDLCTTGPYAIIRNPLYFGNILIYMAAAWLLSHHLLYTLLIGAIFLLQYLFIQAYEEDLCKKIFARPYLEYRSQVPAWIPRWIFHWKWNQIFVSSTDTWRTAFFN